MIWRATVLTLFPEMFPGPLGVSLAGKALGLPTSLLIDKDGCEVGVVAGPANWDKPDAVAAVAALKALNVYDQVAPRLVYGENIAQTAQFVQSGAADAGILALSLAVAPQMRDAGRFWQVPFDAYPRMEQGGIILKSTKNLETARAFRDFVLGDHGREVLKLYGFSLPEK